MMIIVFAMVLMIVLSGLDRPLWKDEEKSTKQLIREYNQRLHSRRVTKKGERK